MRDLSALRLLVVVPCMASIEKPATPSVFIVSSMTTSARAAMAASANGTRKREASLEVGEVRSIVLTPARFWTNRRADISTAEGRNINRLQRSIATRPIRGFAASAQRRGAVAAVKKRLWPKS